MKKLEVTLEIEVEDDVHAGDLFLYDHDVCDGYELLREGSDNTEVFKLGYATIKKIKEI